MSVGGIPLNPYLHVYPLFALRIDAQGRKSADDFLGSSFILDGGLWISAAHCIPPPPSNTQLVIITATSEGDDPPVFSPVHQVSIDENGSDLALGFVKRLGSGGLQLTGRSAEPGERVCSWGYPLMSPGFQDPRGGKVFDYFTPSYVEGYVTRVHKADRVGQGPTRVIEVDMPVPPGLSGGPLIRWGTNEVVGVCSGEKMVSIGSSMPWRLGEAVWTEDLRSARAPLLGGKTLAVGAAMASSGQWSPWNASI